MQSKQHRLIVDAIQQGREIRPPPRSKAALVIEASFLRTVLIGGAFTEVDLGWLDDHRCKLTAAGVVIDGGSWLTDSTVRNVIIRPEPGTSAVDLSNLANADGAALPPLILRNCEIEGELNIQGSHFAALTLHNCTLRRLRADACQIDGECLLADLGPRDRQAKDPELSCCQIRMVAARIDGSVDLRGSRLRADAVAPDSRLAQSRSFAERYALSLASSEINGRLLLTDGFTAIGGVSLFQAEIRTAVRISAAKLEALFEDDAALDAGELKLGGSFTWTSHSNTSGAKRRSRTKSDWDVAGQALLHRANIAGDLLIDDCVWRRTGPKGAQGDYTHGGIDARYIRVEGQMRITKFSVIARRYRPQSGLKPFDEIGPALDCWKGTFARGVRLHEGAVLHGGALFNSCSIQREMFIAAKIQTGDAPNAKATYHQALDLSDARLDGHLVIQTARVEGRVSLQSLRVVGAIDIVALHLVFKGTAFKDAATDISSILDFQDLDLQGGLNLHFEAISVVSERPSRVEHRFVVDLRGMRCDSYDDADGHCWKDLTPSKSRPWRLRFEGISFSRLDKADTVPSIRNNASGADIVRQRAKTLNSFYENRFPSRPPFLERARGEYRATVQKLRGRERDVRQFSPQIYETFAKAYFAKGDVEVGVGLIQTRSDIQWRKRFMTAIRQWVPWSAVAFCLAASCAVAGFIGVLPPSFSLARCLAAACLFAVVPPMMIWALGGLFRALFGYGLRPGRALRAFVTSIILGFFAFQALGAWGFPISPKNAAFADSAFDRWLYVIDLFVPIDLGQTANYAPKDGDAVQRFAIGFYQAMGWIITSLTVVTISGVLKRDIER